VSSKPTSDQLDLERDLPTTAGDVAALVRLPPPASWMAEDRVPFDSRRVYDIVRRRPTARAEWLPFTLPQD
jgi:hypothetical protein